MPPEHAGMVVNRGSNRLLLFFFSAPDCTDYQVPKVKENTTCYSVRFVFIPGYIIMRDTAE